MQYLNSTDLLVRKELISCKIGHLGAQYADDLRLGKSCSLKHRNELFLLQGVLELLKCYNPEGINTGTIQVTVNYDPIISDSIFEIFVGDTSITGPDYYTADIRILVAHINDYQSTYVASTNVTDSTEGLMTLTSECGVSGEISVVIKEIGNMYFDYNGMSENVCTGVNCVTEEEIQEMLNKVCKKYNLCFQPIGFSYVDTSE